MRHFEIVNMARDEPLANAVADFVGEDVLWETLDVQREHTSTTYALIDENKSLIGAATIYPNFKNSNQTYIAHIEIQQEHRRKGHATALMGHIAQNAFLNHDQLLSLYCLDDDLTENFYGKLGFKLTDVPDTLQASSEVVIARSGVGNRFEIS